MKNTAKEKIVVSLYIFESKSYKKGAGEIQVKYNFKNFPSKLLIFRCVLKIIVTGSLLNNQTKFKTPKN